MFAEWVNAQMKAREWNQAELAKQTGMSGAQVSRVLSRASGPGLEFCHKIAKAFDVPLEVVLQQAGLATESAQKNGGAEPSPELLPLIRYLNGLPAERRIEVVRSIANLLDITYIGVSRQLTESEGKASEETTELIAELWAWWETETDDALRMDIQETIGRLRRRGTTDRAVVEDAQDLIARRPRRAANHAPRVSARR